ncbi:MAG: hypothetical protein H7269_03115, partial [Cellulomonas sp.]|nr:hypothetical protein [Cellulomonas sp.]
DTAVGRAVADAVRGKVYGSFDAMASVVLASPSLELVEAAEGPAGERQWTLTVDLVTSSPVPLSYRDARLQTGAG